MCVGLGLRSCPLPVTRRDVGRVDLDGGRGVGGREGTKFGDGGEGPPVVRDRSEDVVQCLSSDSYSHGCVPGSPRSSLSFVAPSPYVPRSPVGG